MMVRQPAERDVFRFLSKARTRKVHFLHIGKTGGSAIKSALSDFPQTSSWSIRLRGHGTSLKEIPKGDSVVFFLRDPVSRFISGFYSRQRKGRPRYHAEWSPSEKEVFERFSTPNDIAVSLADGHASAVMAMESVLHFRRYDAWYVDFDYFRSRLDDVLFVGFQESLDAGFVQLKGLLELPDEVSLPTDDVSAHRNPHNVNRTIDARGIAALREWYSEDDRFVALCRQIMADRANAHRVPSTRRAAA